MKQEMLQMLYSVYKNIKKLEAFVKLIVNFIKKKIGKQKKGKRRSNLINIVCGILYYIKAGCQWRLLPTIFGKWRTVYGWYLRITKLELFQDLWKTLLQYAQTRNVLKLSNLLGDGSLVLTTSSIDHKRKNPRMKNKNCINRLILTDKKGLPIALLISKGTANDTKFLTPLLDQAKANVNLPCKFTVHADKGFDSLSNRLDVSYRGGFAEIPVRNQGFIVELPISRDRKRPIVEHTFAWINAFRALKTIATKKIENLYENTFFVFSVITSRFLSVKNINNLIGSF